MWPDASDTSSKRAGAPEAVGTSAWRVRNARGRLPLRAAGRSD